MNESYGKQPACSGNALPAGIHAVWLFLPVSLRGLQICHSCCLHSKTCSSVRTACLTGLGQITLVCRVLLLSLSCLCEPACSQGCLSQGDGRGGTCVWLKTALTPCSQEISAGCRTVALGFCATAGFLVAAASSAFLTPSPARPRTGCLSVRIALLGACSTPPAPCKSKHCSHSFLLSAPAAGKG